MPRLEEARDLLLAPLMRVLPIDWVSDFGAWMGEREGRRAIAAKRLWVQRLRDNFARFSGVVDPAEADRMVLAYTARVGRTYAEIPVMQRMVAERRVEIAGRENIHGLTRPTIFASCHLALWEVLAQAATLLPGGTTALYVPPANPVHTRFVLQARRSWSIDAELVAASPSAMRRIVRALAGGRNLLIFVDEEKDGYVWGPSLGRALPRAGNRWLAARLAVRHGADIVPVHVEAQGKARYRVIIEPKLDAGGGSREAQAASLAEQLDACFDAWIRAGLGDWYWLSVFEPDKAPPARS